MYVFKTIKCNTELTVRTSHSMPKLRLTGNLSSIYLYLRFDHKYTFKGTKFCENCLIFVNKVSSVAQLIFPVLHRNSFNDDKATEKPFMCSLSAKQSYTLHIHNVYLRFRLKELKDIVNFFKWTLQRKN